MFLVGCASSVVCCLLFVGCCLLFNIVRCSLCVVRRALRGCGLCVVCCVLCGVVLSVVCYVMLFAHCPLFVVGCSLLVVCWPL